MYRHPSPPPRPRFRASRGVFAAVLSGLLGVALAVSPIGMTPTAAGGVGLRIVVDTSTDADALDGYCSFREAIKASNGGYWNECQGTIYPDSIVFSITYRVIDVDYPLPEITAPVTINGGASKVRIHGPSKSGAGLSLGSNADGSTIRSMVIDNFSYGIFAGSATAIVRNNTLTGNNFGIFATHSALTIGGINTPTATANCGGDCNLISGNSTGMYLELMQSYSVTGNFIGVDAAGTAAQGNTNTGILVSAGTGTIGGPTARERNIVSGNGVDGVKLVNCGQCPVIGNFIGTDVTGAKAIPNGGNGVYVRDGHALVGGTAVGEGNVISGNVGHGLFVEGWTGLNDFAAYGNRIGIKAVGGDLGNAGDGIQVRGTAGPVRDVTIGSETDAAAANIVAFNDGAGIRVRPCASRVTMRRNSIHTNTGPGIVLEAGVAGVCPTTNGAIAAPSVTGLLPVTGTSCPDCIIDVYSDSADEGRTWEGSVFSDAAGEWELGKVVAGPNVTATATDLNGNTSAFSTPFAVPQPRKPDGRIRKGTGSLIGNNVYNTTGVNQTKTGSTTRGNTITFGISIQNDAASDRFTVQATGTSTSLYSVSYFRNSTNITAAVVAGTYATPTLANGSTFVITAKVKVNSTATVGSNVTRLITLTSVGDATRKDAVKLIAKRS